MIRPECKEQMPSLPKVCPVCGLVLNGDGGKTLLVVLLMAGIIRGAFAAGLIIIINGLILLLVAATRCKVGSSHI